MKNVLLFFLIILIPPSLAQADWINLTGAENSRNIAEIYVENDHVKIQLEVYIQDLLIFNELVPDSLFSEPISGRPGLEERIQAFAESGFQVVTDSGEKLSAKFDLAEPRLRVHRPSPFAGSINPYTRQRD